MREAPGVEFVAVADVYDRNASAAREWAGPGCQAYADFRELLDRKDVDAVVVATPDHWHAGVTVLACAAGKDVYTEKPLAHNIREGRAMVQAARHHNRIVQAGMQHRSSPHFAEAAEMVQHGKLGKVHFVRVWNYVNMVPRGIGRALDEPAPKGLDWDMYCGPAPLVRFNRKRFLSTYRWFWDYSGGYITDYGTHRFDTMRQIDRAHGPRAGGGHPAVHPSGGSHRAGGRFHGLGGSAPVPGRVLDGPRDLSGQSGRLLGDGRHRAPVAQERRPLKPQEQLPELLLGLLDARRGIPDDKSSLFCSPITSEQEMRRNKSVHKTEEVSIFFFFTLN